MRAHVTWLVSLASLALAGATVGAGCYQLSSDCSLFACGSTGGPDGGTGGDGGSVPVGCDPSTNTNPVADTCGMFVSPSGDDDNPGTKAKPLKTLAAAMKKGTTIYACASSTSFKEAVTIDKNVTLFGALNCEKGWAYEEKTKTQLTAGNDEIPLRLTSTVSDGNVYDFAITATKAMTEGGSSIAVLADGATATLTRCDLVAGDGAKGKDGDPGDANGNAASAGVSGNTGKDACSAPEPISGGLQVSNDCGGNVSIGGDGGSGKALNGSNGQPGLIGAFGAAGAGEPPAGGWSCNGPEPNGAGDGGDDGSSGDPGDGAKGLGTLSTSGYDGIDGSPGMPGTPGQGGGGGGGAKGGAAICTGSTAGGGSSGGSGGSGGCGGKPGQGGKAGGSSIALLSFNATLSLSDCNLTAGNGGDGGKGGDLQAGGSGGDPGKGGKGTGGSKDACDGGKGGQGGNGGPGGGGLGGHSLTVAYQGPPVTKLGAMKLTPNMPGSGGLGGSGNVATNTGDKGVAAAEQEFK